MADVTQAQLMDRVAQKLGILAATDTLSAEDGEVIRVALKSVAMQLAKLEIASFYIENGLAYEYADAFSDLAAAELADVFEVPEPRRSILSANRLGMPGRSPAERRMRSYFPSEKLQTVVDFVVQ